MQLIRALIEDTQDQINESYEEFRGLTLEMSDDLDLLLRFYQFKREVCICS